ncbi:MAG TPA: DUF2726 domain-containing protein [Noviherbaspirillum sp.]|nr:DUF2726 domain-containing protein [Noviherbaspirillum sp.]
MAELGVFLVILGSGLLGWFILNRPRPARFRARPILTGSALEFLFRLKRALPECTVCPQVAATSLLEPLGVGRARKAALSRIVGRRVGYAVFDEEMQLIAVIELDHRPRLTRREAECDSYFSEAGVPVLRFRQQQMPSVSKIRSSVFPRAAATVQCAEQSMPDAAPIEFKPRAAIWRNTLNAHS